MPSRGAHVESGAGGGDGSGGGGGDVCGGGGGSGGGGGGTEVCDGVDQRGAPATFGRRARPSGTVHGGDGGGDGGGSASRAGTGRRASTSSGASYEMASRGKRVTSIATSIDGLLIRAPRRPSGNTAADAAASAASVASKGAAASGGDGVGGAVDSVGRVPASASVRMAWRRGAAKAVAAAAGAGAGAGREGKEAAFGSQARDMHGKMHDLAELRGRRTRAIFKVGRRKFTRVETRVDSAWFQRLKATCDTNE